MDVSLLPHLSDDALREEARVRGLVLTGASRDELIAALRAHLEGSLEPGDDEIEERAPTIPPADAGAFGAARSFFGKLAQIAKNTIERRETQPPPPTAPAPRPITSDEPIRTRTMAELLVKQGHLDRAYPLLAELSRAEPDDAQLRATLERVGDQLAERGLRHDAMRALGDLLGPFIALVAHDHARAVVYRLDEDKLLRGRALLVAEGTPTLRVVSIERLPNARIVSRHEDHPLDALEGWRRLDTSTAARLVVAVGLSDRGRFVSLLHATFEP